MERTLFVISVSGAYNGKIIMYELNHRSIKEAIKHIKDTCMFEHTDLKGTIIKPVTW